MKNNPFQKNNSKLTAKDILSLSNRIKDKGGVEDLNYLAPRNDREQQIHGFFADLLGKEQVGVLDNFFQIGGNSLKATQLISQLHKHFNVELSLTQVFDHSTIEALANFVEDTQWHQQIAEPNQIVDKTII